MRSDPESLNHFIRLIDTAEAEDQMRVVVTKEGNGFILAGAHSADAWCWCQPIVIDVPCTNGMMQGTHMSHAQVNHRRAMDAEVLEDENEMGFWVDKDGGSYPEGQVCVGPKDRPHS